MEMEQRAWVLPIDAIKDPKPQGSVPPGRTPYVVILNNFGRTPALDVKVRVEPIFFGGTELPPDQWLPAFRDTGSLSILPHGTGAVSEKRVTLHWIQNEMETAKALYGKSELYFFILGKVEYSDVFGRKRTTMFCFRRLAGDMEGQMNFAPTFNRVD